MQDRRMTGEAWRVLGALMERMGWDNDSVATIAEIVETKQMSQPQVSRALKRLQAVGVVEHFQRGRYHINCEYFYVGDDAKKGYRRKQEHLARVRKQTKLLRRTAPEE